MKMARKQLRFLKNRKVLSGKSVNITTTCTTNKKQGEIKKRFCKILRRAVTKIDLEDINKLDCVITEGEVSVTLKNMKNNVAPEPGGLGGVFYKTFWKYLKWVVVGSIREIYDNRELPLSQRLGIIALIPKSDKDQRFIKTGHLSLCLKLSTN